MSMSELSEIRVEAGSVGGDEAGSSLLYLQRHWGQELGSQSGGSTTHGQVPGFLVLTLPILGARSLIPSDVSVNPFPLVGNI